jgi:23S rRNA (cytidine2498-2'-O)-methyltransferase
VRPTLAHPDSGAHWMARAVSILTGLYMAAPEGHRTHEFIATFDPDFADLAIAELREDAGAVQVGQELAPGVLLINTSRRFLELAQQWREDPPVFIRHICPAGATVHLEGTPDDLSHLEGKAIEKVAPDLDASRSFSVQSRVFGDLGYRPYDVNTRLASALAAKTGAIVDVRHPQQIVSVVCAPGSAIQKPAGYVGLSQASDNLSDWAGGMRRYAREPGQVSRSEFKLLEALEAFEIELPPRGVALDLGAAPGGWTRVLRQRAQYVTAVDPGELHPSIRADAGVRHLKCTAEDYLAQGPDCYDLIVNDMRMDGRDSARLIVRYADHLYPGGQVIMTLKLPGKSRRSVIDHALSILTGAYSVAGMKQLFHNRSEITLYLTIRDPKVGVRDG